jgi:hypothetical protein
MDRLYKLGVYAPPENPVIDPRNQGDTSITLKPKGAVLHASQSKPTGSTKKPPATGQSTNIKKSAKK